MPINWNIIHFPKRDGVLIHVIMLTNLKKKKKLRSVKETYTYGIILAFYYGKKCNQLIRGKELS